MVVRLPAGPQVSLKCGDQSKDNGAGHKKNGWCCIAICRIGAGNGDSWYHMCASRFHFWGRKVNWNQASHVRASSVQSTVALAHNKDPTPIVDKLRKQFNHRHIFSHWEINYEKFANRVSNQLPVHYGSEATLQQNVQDRDFPSRRVRKKPPWANVNLRSNSFSSTPSVWRRYSAPHSIFRLAFRSSFSAGVWLAFPWVSPFLYFACLWFVCWGPC